MISNTNKEIVRIGLVQMACAEDAAANMKAAEQGIRNAAGQGAQIICLQELFRTLYFCQTEVQEHFKRAEEIPGPSTQAMSQLASALGVVLILPLFEKRSTGIYHNTAVVLDADGSIAGRYRKMHIPDDPGFYEKFYFTPGDTGFQTIPTRFGKIGVLICWDQWFPEAARLTALSGAQILFYPTAIGYQAFDEPVAGKQAQAWQTIQKAHSIANGVFTVVVNRVGSMMTPFFQEGPVVDYASATRSDTEAYAAFARRLLEGGVYPPPSQYEAWFVSAAHGPEELAATGQALEAATA